MKINKRLNLALPVERANGSTIYVHSMPISEEIYDANFLLLSKVVSSMYREGLAPGIAARNGLRMIRRVAIEMGVMEEVDRELLQEIWRLTNVIADGKVTPFVIAENDPSILDKEDAAEVKNFICFFTSASWVHKRAELDEVLYPMLRDSGAQIVSLNSTEFMNSLTTSNVPGTTGASPPAIASSPPH